MNAIHAHFSFRAASLTNTARPQNSTISARCIGFGRTGKLATQIISQSALGKASVKGARRAIR